MKDILSKNINMKNFTDKFSICLSVSSIILVFFTCTTASIDLLAAKVKSGSDDVELKFLWFDRVLIEYCGIMSLSNDTW